MAGRTEFLILRFDAPMQSWGSVALDPVRPTHNSPTLSALAGMLASALGWSYRDGARTTALQQSLRYAVREERPPQRLRDYQTADLGRIGREGWTRWGLERRGGGAAATGTQILDKHYLADGTFLVAVAIGEGAPASLEEIVDALQRPSRPLYLGRKACIPASPILVGRIEAATAYEALALWTPIPGPSIRAGSEGEFVYCWYADGDGPSDGEPIDVWDRRDFVTDRFEGARRVRRTRLPVASVLGGEPAE